MTNKIIYAVALAIVLLGGYYSWLIDNNYIYEDVQAGFHQRFLAIYATTLIENQERKNAINFAKEHNLNSIEYYNYYSPIISEFSNSLSCSYYYLSKLDNRLFELSEKLKKYNDSESSIYYNYGCFIEVEYGEQCKEAKLRFLKVYSDIVSVNKRFSEYRFSSGAEYYVSLIMN